jgi:hypothetical protein
MTDTPQLPDTVEETLVLLRRFASMLSGSNSDNLFRAVFLIEDMSHDLRVMSEAFEAERKNHAEDLDRCNTAEAKVVELTARINELTMQLDAERISAETAQEKLTEEKEALQLRNDQVTSELEKQSNALKQGIVMPTSQLSLAMTQFRALAREFRRKGDIASEVMCEIGYRAIDLKVAEVEPETAKPSDPPAPPPTLPPPFPTSDR